MDPRGPCLWGGGGGTLSHDRASTIDYFRHVNTSGRDKQRDDDVDANEDRKDETERTKNSRRKGAGGGGREKMS